MTDSQKKTIIELRNKGISYRQIGKLIGLNHGTVCKFCQQIGLDGIRAEKHVWDDPNEYLSKYNPNLEYVSGWTSVDGHAVIRFKDCGHKYKCSMKTVRSHPEYSCKFCTEIRRQEAAEQRAEERERELQQREKQKAAEQERRFWNQSFEQGEWKVCPVCNSLFFQTSRRKYCSEHCMNQRKWMMKEGYRHLFPLDEVYERDGGICYLCGKPCDWNDYEVKNGVIVYGNNYPSRDHVIPKSKGGSNSWENIKLAHRICNSLKSNSPCSRKNERKSVVRAVVA